jgi:hypothetical protein
MCTRNILIPVDDRAGHHAAAVGEQKDDKVGDLVDLAHFPHRQLAVGGVEPAVVGIVELPLDCVFAFGLSPADVDTVDADLVPAVRERGVTGQTSEPGLCCGVRAEVRLTPMLGHGDDVDDRARLSAAQHIRDRSLHREERRPQVDRQVLIEKLDRSVQQRAASSETG